jgi:hypothetical protein
MPNQRTRQRRKGRPVHDTAHINGEKVRIFRITSYKDVQTKCIYISNCSAYWLMATVTSIFCTCNTFSCNEFTCHAAIGAERLSDTEVLIQFSSLERAREAFKLYFNRPYVEKCCWYSDEHSRELQRNVNFYSVHYDLYSFFLDENLNSRKVTHSEHLRQLKRGQSSQSSKATR